MQAEHYVFVDARVATLSENSDLNTPYGLINQAAVAVNTGCIDWVGPQAALPSRYTQWPQHSCDGRLITPALIDCHSHTVHGGHRALEFEQRLQGANYSDIARAGGGIMSTVNATRASSEQSLLREALQRVDSMLAQGLSTLEIKSGYGLDTETELRMLRVARAIGESRPLQVRTSFLGAHALPPEYNYRADEYIDRVCIPTLERANAEGLVDAVDGFCESIAFDKAQIRRVFDCAVSLGLPMKLHAEQLSNSGGSALAAGYGALSADHLEYLDDAGIAAMAGAGTVAVLLPGAYYTLNETQRPPVDALRQARVPMAVATDYNPGSSPLGSILLALNMSCTLFKLSPEEALRGATQHAATALGLSDRGQIRAGLRADLAIWDVEHPAELIYRIAFNPLFQRIYEGIR